MRSNSLKKFLSNVNPFQSLPESKLETLAYNSRQVQHEAGETIFREGDSAQHVWLLMSGRIKIMKYSAERKDHALELIQPKDFFGTLCRLGGNDQPYPCTAVTMEKSSSIRIPEKIFLDLFEQYPAFISGICSLCSDRLNMMKDLTCISQEPVEARIVRTLLSLAQGHGTILPYTKQQIGEFSATTVETTIRTLGRFQKKNWISSTRGKILIKNTEKLKALIN